jgi:CCR4-NOT transcription complex subunit 2
MRGHSNKPEPNRASRVFDVGLASRATRVRLTSTIKGNADAENQTKYGLLGLLDVIRMTNADLNTLALGSDLTTLGLNLNSSECLYSTFASPWAEAPITREPQFSLPLCYYMQPPPLKTQYLSQNKLCLALLTAPSFVSHYAT